MEPRAHHAMVQLENQEREEDEGKLAQLVPQDLAVIRALLERLDYQDILYVI